MCKPPFNLSNQYSAHNITVSNLTGCGCRAGREFVVGAVLVGAAGARDAASAAQVFGFS